MLSMLFCGVPRGHLEASGEHLLNVSHERRSLAEYSVSFMTEFHEVKCPDHIGGSRGTGKSLSDVFCNSPMWGRA